MANENLGRDDIFQFFELQQFLIRLFVMKIGFLLIEKELMRDCINQLID